jgi:hypothetical protein
MDKTEKPKERIALRNDQQTTVAIGLFRKGKSAIEPGDKITVASSAGTILSAWYNHETHVIDVVPIEGAQGPADVTVGITLADGTVLPSQTVMYEVKHPDAEAVVLTPGAIGEKKTVIVVPLPNPEPHVVAEPEHHETVKEKAAGKTAAKAAA